MHAESVPLELGILSAFLVAYSATEAYGIEKEFGREG